jgi:hypothetical protein
MDFPTASTDSQLRDWVHGDTAAERLAADILRLEQFQNIDPQSPLGGPDGGKDILCDKDRVLFVTACYFPNGQTTFSTVRKKFSADLGSSLRHGREGLIFITNQHLTPGERSELEALAAKEGKRCLIFHRERLRVSLDSPHGYGIRLKHLRITLSSEEQFAYFATSGDSVKAALDSQREAIELLSHKIDDLSAA